MHNKHFFNICSSSFCEVDSFVLIFSKNTIQADFQPKQSFKDLLLFALGQNKSNLISIDLGNRTTCNIYLSFPNTIWQQELMLLVTLGIHLYYKNSNSNSLHHRGITGEEIIEYFNIGPHLIIFKTILLIPLNPFEIKFDRNVPQIFLYYKVCFCVDQEFNASLVTGQI